ncbi:hypothetical protein ACFPN7_33200 [Amycolatopsis halotolerans]|uniref:hypothetical protein n=1 Tax=Amycolatopsis halotolerans TaxID=330083 RepID=UPI003617DD25
MTRLVHRSGREQVLTSLQVTHLSEFIGWAPPSCVTDPEEADVHRPHTGGRSMAVEMSAVEAADCLVRALRPPDRRKAVRRLRRVLSWRRKLRPA